MKKRIKKSAKKKPARTPAKKRASLKKALVKKAKETGDGDLIESMLKSGRLVVL